MSIEAHFYNENDQLIAVTGFLIQGQKGICEYGERQQTPDDEPEMEITSSMDAEGLDVELTPEEQQDALEALWGELKAY